MIKDILFVILFVIFLYSFFLCWFSPLLRKIRKVQYYVIAPWVVSGICLVSAWSKGSVQTELAVIVPMLAIHGLVSIFMLKSKKPVNE